MDDDRPTPVKLPRSAAWFDYLQRAQRRHGSKLDLSEVDAADHFLPYFGTGTRLRVAWGDGPDSYVRTGTVTITTGWRPALLLLHRRTDRGSSDVLGPRDVIVGVKRPGERSYRPPPTR